MRFVKCVYGYSCSSNICHGILTSNIGAIELVVVNKITKSTRRCRGMKMNRLWKDLIRIMQTMTRIMTRSIMTWRLQAPMAETTICCSSDITIRVVMDG